MNKDESLLAGILKKVKELIQPPTIEVITAKVKSRSRSRSKPKEDLPKPILEQSLEQPTTKERDRTRSAPLTRKTIRTQNNFSKELTADEILDYKIKELEKSRRAKNITQQYEINEKAMLPVQIAGNTKEEGTFYDGLCRQAFL